MDSRSRAEKLRAMAAQDASPHEAKIARAKLAEMGGSKPAGYPSADGPPLTLADLRAAEEALRRRTYRPTVSNSTIHFDGPLRNGDTFSFNIKITTEW